MDDKKWLRMMEIVVCLMPMQPSDKYISLFIQINHHLHHQVLQNVREKGYRAIQIFGNFAHRR